jgi:hypothetical protein
MQSAWKAVGIYPYNPEIISLDKLVPSKTSTTQLTAANAIHSTPVWKIMSAFSYFNASLGRDDGSSDGDDNRNSGGGGNDDRDDGGGDDNCNDSGDNTNDPFLPSFTPRSHMHILRKSFSSNLSTSYLVSKEPVNSSLNLIKPVHKNPYFIKEPDWLLTQKPVAGGPDQLSHEQLVKVRACDAVIEASCATAAILELQAQKLQNALHMKEDNQKRKKKATISLNVGDGAVITEDGFIKKVEVKREVREKKKKEKEGRKRARQKKGLLRKAQRGAWEMVCNEYETEKAKYDRLCQELRENGTKVRDLPLKPKRHLQKEVFDEVREEWERDVDMDEDPMEVDEEASDFADNFEIEMLPFHGEISRASPDWSGNSREEEKEDSKGEDLMDVTFQMR